jgi:hypothetical protein
LLKEPAFVGQLFDLIKQISIGNSTKEITTKLSMSDCHEFIMEIKSLTLKHILFKKKGLDFKQKYVTIIFQTPRIT